MVIIFSDEKLCKTFKKAMLMKESNEKLLVEISTLERCFHYNASSLQTSFIPKKIRSLLSKIGVKLKKQRGRSLIEVMIE